MRLYKKRIGIIDGTTQIGLGTIDCDLSITVYRLRPDFFFYYSFYPIPSLHNFFVGSLCFFDFAINIWNNDQFETLIIIWAINISLISLFKFFLWTHLHTRTIMTNGKSHCFACWDSFSHCFIWSHYFGKKNAEKQEREPKYKWKQLIETQLVGKKSQIKQYTQVKKPKDGMHFLSLWLWKFIVDCQIGEAILRIDRSKNPSTLFEFVRWWWSIYSLIWNNKYWLLECFWSLIHKFWDF